MDKKLVADELYKAAGENGIVEVLDAVFGNNIKVIIPFSKNACETNVDELDLSVRSSNALKRGGIMKIGDLVDTVSGDRLMNIRNLGKKSYYEIKTKIMVFGYLSLPESEKKEFWLNTVEKNS